MTDAREGAYLQALEEVAARAAAAGRLEPPGFEAVLRTVVETAVALFDAEAVSIALHDPAADRLVIRVAAGPQGEGAVGIEFAAADGHRGLRVHDRSAARGRRRGRGPALRPHDGRADRLRAALDPRRAGDRRRRCRRRPRGAGPARGRELRAPRPRPRVAVRAPGRHGRPRHAGRAWRRGAAARRAGPPRRGLRRRPGSPRGRRRAVARELDGEDGDRLWALADAVARARAASPEQVGLVVEILEALARRAVRPAPRSFRR